MQKYTLTCALGAILAATPALAEEVVSFASYGGAYQEAIRKAMLEPILEEHGITTREDTLSGGIPEVRTRVRGGANDLDVVELYGGQCQQAANEGLLVPLDYDQIPNAEGIPEELRAEHWIGFTAYSTVIAWNTNVYDEAPQNWADFFDTERFPGPRAMSVTSAQTNLEAALLADGVAPEDIYPLDVDRALAKLEELRPDVAVWWTTGAQAGQLALSEEVDMLAIWTARIHAAIEDGAPFDYTLEQGLMDVECLVVPAGSPNPEGAMRLINLLLEPKYQANLPQYIPYGPMHQDAFALLTEEESERIITSEENLAKHVILDKPYWAEHGQELQERWDAFLQQ